MRFSEYFNLNKSQHELDFVDIPMDIDLPLFLDPYAITKRNDEFSADASQITINFFQKIIEDIKNGKFNEAKINLQNLGEPNDTHLGLSKSKLNGKGIGDDQSIDVFERLKNSRAVQSGLLKDLSECELIIPGISRDKISDIVTNIIKAKLIEYTEQQCQTYNIACTKVASGKFWDPINQEWTETYVNLPIYKGARIILVPKALVRYSIEFNHSKYYNGFVLEYLQQQHIDSNTSLVNLLKNGEKRVYKKDLKKIPEYKESKEFLYQFSEEHPSVLTQYVNSLPDNINSLTNEEIEKKQTTPKSINYEKLISDLQSIPSGTEHATDFHNQIIGILEVIFYPNLIVPVKEEKIHEGRKRIDITYQNAAKQGFFEYITKHIPCSFIMTECKNYSNDPNNPELDQLSGRFSPRRGQFGMLICRNINDKDLMKKRCRDTADDGRGFILTLDDRDIIALIKMRENNDTSGIENFLTERYKELVM